MAAARSDLFDAPSGYPPEAVTAPRTGAVYNCHAFLTKVPLGGIEPFIRTFTRAGETVADPYAGSGMTGLAAAKLGRHACVSDISVLGQHIAAGYAMTVDAEYLRQAAAKAIARTRERIGSLYTTYRQHDGVLVEFSRTVWSFVYECPSCGRHLNYYECLPAKKGDPHACDTCDHPFNRRKWAKVSEEPVRVVLYNQEGRLVEQLITQYDLDCIERAKSDARQRDVPSLTIDPSREMYARSGLSKAGIEQTRDFFSPRNAITLLELRNAIAENPDHRIRTKLLFAFTAILARASKRYQWGRKRPLNAQNQTYYVAPVFYEWNIFELFNRKVEAAIKSDTALGFSASNREAQIEYRLASADNLSHIPDNSTDYVFTDPPFGSNIYYSDMTLFHEAWLDQTTESTSEAVVHTVAGRREDSKKRYECLLAGSFQEAYRILKPGRYISVVFGNSNGEIWGLVQRALRHAGFGTVPENVAILDKGQRSVKGLNSGSEAVATLDLIITFRKPDRDEGDSVRGPSPSKTNAQDIIQTILEEAGNREGQDPSYVYLEALKRAIGLNYALDNLHLSDVLMALADWGYYVDSQTARLVSRRAQI